MASKKTTPAALKSVLPKVKLTVDEVDYWLVYDFNAMAEAETLTGLNLLQCLSFQSLNATKVRGLLYAALLRLQPDTSLEDAGNLLGSTDSGVVMKAIGQAYLGSQPEPEPEVKNDQPGSVS
jgi:hypothetical protein